MGLGFTSLNREVDIWSIPWATVVGHDINGAWDVLELANRAYNFEFCYYCNLP
jgi:hypothetical protein